MTGDFFVLEDESSCLLNKMCLTSKVVYRSMKPVNICSTTKDAVKTMNAYENQHAIVARTTIMTKSLVDMSKQRRPPK